MKAKSDLNTSSFKEEKSLSDFIHRIGHDIGNPLTSLISLASLLERSSSDSKFELSKEDNSKYLKSIIGDAWRIQALVEKTILLLSERSSSDESSINVGEVIQQSIRKVLRKPAFQQFDISFAPTSEELKVKISRSALEWLCTELITNALNHLSLSEDGYENPVNVSLKKVADKAVIEVKNNLISEQNFELKSLFEPFVKFPENSKGGGLGLTAANCVAIKANSELAIEIDEADKSFKAIVELPLAPV
jgi:signal transduction histidine kinase